VLIVSGSAEAETVKRASELRVQGYLLKPVFPEDLLASVAQWAGAAPPH
jgi:CheY-like chemotaxis protein